MRKYVSVAICTVAAVAVGICLTYGQNRHFGAVHIIGLVVLIVGARVAKCQEEGLSWMKPRDLHYLLAGASRSRVPVAYPEGSAVAGS